MKKLAVLVFLLCLVLQIGFAQSNTATGTVKDGRGNAIPYAFLRDRPGNNAAFADSAGNFKLKVLPNSSLEVKGTGYLNALINTGNVTDFQVVLRSAADKSDSAGQASPASTAFKQNIFSQHNTADKENQNFVAGDRAIFAAPKKEDTRGSQYLFDNWVHGYFTNTSDSLAENAKYFYNYDKIKSLLLLTQDKATAIQVDDKQFKSFTLFDNSGNNYRFEKVPVIDGVHYTQVLSEGSKYAIYKKISTHLTMANYSSNGIASSGNKYDEYTDEFIYYVFNEQTKQLRKLNLRKKSLKEAFPADADKINKYMASHSGDIDDAYLSDLGDYLNN